MQKLEGIKKEEWVYFGYFDIGTQIQSLIYISQLENIQYKQSKRVLYNNNK